MSCILDDRLQVQGYKGIVFEDENTHETRSNCLCPQAPFSKNRSTGHPVRHRRTPGGFATKRLRNKGRTARRSGKFPDFAP
jgi:hypothetical protein